MYKEYKTQFGINPFVQIKAERLPLWRYMDLHKFLDLVKTSSLYFAPLKKMGDEYEGTVFDKTEEETIRIYKEVHGQSEETATKNAKGLTYIVKTYNIPNQFISCWTAKEYECFPLWKLYAKDKYGVAVKTNFQRLCNALKKEAKDIYIGDVYYDNESQNWLETGNAFRFTLSKKVFYKEEDEVRCIIQTDEEKFHESPKVIVDLNELIEEVYITEVSANNGYKDVIEHIKKDKGLNFEIKVAGIKDSWL